MIVGADTATWVTLCGRTAPLAAFVVFLAPLPTMKQIQKDGAVGNLPLLPYSSMLANCFLWFAYGYLKKQPTIWGTNLVGLVFAVYYFLTFIKYAPARSPTLPGSVRQHVHINVFLIAFTLVGMLFSPVRDPAEWIGNTAVLFCVAMFGSPLAALRTVLQKKSAKSIPLPFTLATCLNCVLWLVFGLFEVKDVKIYLPNLLGLSCGLAQLALKLIFGNGKKALRQKDRMDMFV